MEHLDLSDNSLMGGIPPEIGNLSRLKVLNLYNSSLTGSIPPELGNLSGLKELFLAKNLELSGCIPKALSNSVTDLYIDETDLTGYCE